MPRLSWLPAAPGGRWTGLVRACALAFALVALLPGVAPCGTRDLVELARSPAIPPSPEPPPTSAIEVHHPTPCFQMSDTIEVVARRGLVAGFRISRTGSRVLGHPDLASPRPVSVALLMKPRTMELSRFACAIYGADQAAGTAAALGGAGLVAGVWGEKTTGYLMGAGAILGAIWGGTAGADDSRFRIRVEAGPPRTESESTRSYPTTEE